jgi:hypothetical protein
MSDAPLVNTTESFLGLLVMTRPGHFKPYDALCCPSMSGRDELVAVSCMKRDVGGLTEVLRLRPFSIPKEQKS